MWSKPINRVFFPDYIYQVINHSSGEKHSLLCFEMKIVKTALWQPMRWHMLWSIFLNLCKTMQSIFNCRAMMSRNLRNELQCINSLLRNGLCVCLCVSVSDGIVLNCCVFCRCSSRPPPWQCPWAWVPLCPSACFTSLRSMLLSFIRSRTSRRESAASKPLCRRPPCPHTYPRSPTTNRMESPRLSQTDHSEINKTGIVFSILSPCWDGRRAVKAMDIYVSSGSIILFPPI